MERSPTPTHVALYLIASVLALGAGVAALVVAIVLVKSAL
jgi:hypothetical protein